ncbi:uncharacterized protein GLRG_11322 [Colletotrichum graminicola M1.001]|uniref:Uncharacterized protein n=1 Tax=Colletotrichum graminicola (strain M1.001 / M2 / FGSC 10212) TaxID=645133 RepID=E3QZ93_COLGM|nr:uncharacterized protein GLRG_11322 [Colletotrichum graminicola M1.001]EFQ36181.1 hypothetical protein GLRG_11322 [Colletotrichum graminicola M1.001]
MQALPVVAIAVICPVGRPRELGPKDHTSNQRRVRRGEGGCDGWAEAEATTTPP